MVTLKGFLLPESLPPVMDLEFQVLEQERLDLEDQVLSEVDITINRRNLNITHIAEEAFESSALAVF